MNVRNLIARDELRLMRPNRVAVVAFVLLILLTLIATVSSWSHRQGIAELPARHQQAAETAFDAQPDRHPRRVVHYGNFIFRPLGALAAFDPGVAWLARTDLTAHLAYRDRIRAFHRRLREFYYDYLFYDRPFGKADFAKAPRFGGDGG